MEHDKSKFREFEEECMGCSLGDETLDLSRSTDVCCQSYMKPLTGGSLSVAKLTT